MMLDDMPQQFAWRFPLDSILEPHTTRQRGKSPLITTEKPTAKGTLDPTQEGRHCLKSNAVDAHQLVRAT